jgi:hypothetical protein
MASEPKSPWVGAEGQFEGHEDAWQQSSTRIMPYLEYRPVSLGGTQAPPPQRAQVDTSKMQLSMMALQEADNFIQSTTSIYDPSLGKAASGQESGRKVLALQSQSDAGTSHYLASMADVSLTYEARVILDLIPHVYDRPGRVTRILGGEDDTREVMLNAPFVPGPDGRPQQVQMPPGMPGQPPQLPQGAQAYNLKDGSYAISVSIGKSYQTRLQQGSEEIGEILSAQPALMPVLGATYFRFRDFPGAKEIADILKKLRDQQYPNLAEDDKGGKPTVEQLQAQLAAMQQQGQMMQQQLEAAAKALETEQAKQQATLQKAQMDNAAKGQVAQMQEEAKERERALKLEIQRREEEFERWKVQFEAAAKAQLARFEAAHDVGMAAAGANTMTMRREGGQEEGEERGSEESSSPAQRPPQ